MAITANRKILLAVAVGVGMLCGVAGYYVLYTAAGGGWAVRQVVSLLIGTRQITVKHVRGNMVEGLALEQVRADNTRWLPPDSSVLIPRMDIRVSEIWRGGTILRISGATIDFPRAGIIAFSGSLTGRYINARASADRLTVSDIAALFPDIAEAGSLAGVITGVQVRVSGLLTDAVYAGGFALQDARYDDYVFSRGTCAFTTRIRRTWQGFEARGNVRMSDLSGTRINTEDIRADIQNISLDFDSRDISTLRIDVFNGGLITPVSEKILFYGSYRGEMLDVTLYCKKLSVSNVVSLMGAGTAAGTMAGSVADVDLRLAGTPAEPVLSGTLRVEHFAYQNIFVSDLPLSVSVRMREGGVPPRITGRITGRSGRVFGRRTAVIHLAESHIDFTGDPGQPQLALKGTARVEQTRINILLGGTPREPELKLSSAPPLPQERLAVMLMTGRSWRGAEQSLAQQEISSALAADVISYFILGDTEAALAQMLGVTDISLRIDRDTRGIGVQKDVSSRASVSYGVEQTNSSESRQAAQTTQKVEVDYKISDILSVGSAKEFRQDQETPDSGWTIDNEVYFKIRIEF